MKAEELQYLKAQAYINAPEGIPAWFSPPFAPINNRIDGPEVHEWWQHLNKENKAFLHDLMAGVIHDNVDAGAVFPPGTKMKTDGRLDFLKNPKLAGADEGINMWWRSVAFRQKEIQQEFLKRDLRMFQLWRQFYAWYCLNAVSPNEDYPGFIKSVVSEANGTITAIEWKTL